MKVFNLLLFLVLIFGASLGEAQTKRTAGETKFGFLEKFERTNEGYQIKIDYAEMFEDEAAEREAKRDGEPSPGETSGIYIRNKNPKIHTEKVAQDAAVIVLKNLEPYKLTLDEFNKLLSGKLPNADEFWGFSQRAADREPMPCRVTVKNSVIIKIEQVYFP